MYSSQKNKNDNGCLTASALTIIALGVSYYFGRNFILGSELTFNSGAKIIPANAIITGFISTDNNNWQKLSQFGTPNAQQLVNKTWKDWQTEITSENQDINYQQDIQPWLGNMMFAIFPNYQSAVEYNLVAVLGIKNKIQAFQFLQKIEKENQNNLQKNNYQNVDIFNFNVKDNQPVSAAILGNKLVISNTESTIKQIIDTSKSNNSLGTQTKYSQARQQKLSLKNMVMQFYIPNYNKLLFILAENAFETNNLSANEENITNINSVIMGLGIENHGLQIQGKIDLTEPINEENLKPVTDELIAKLPDKTILMVNGSGINQVWQELNKQQQISPDWNELIDEGKKFTQENFDLDLDQDIFSWLDGQFAFGLFPDQQNSILNSGLKGLLFLQTSHRPSGDLAFQKIEKVVGFTPFISSKSQNIQGIQVQEWTMLQTPILAYGWLNQDSLAMSLGSKFEEINNINYQNSLLNNDTFKLTIKSLPQNNYGYFYLNVEKALNFVSTIESGYNQLIPPDSMAVLESIDAIAMTTSKINSLKSQFDLNITLETKKNK